MIDMSALRYEISLAFEISVSQFNVRNIARLTLGNTRYVIVKKDAEQ